MNLSQPNRSTLPRSFIFVAIILVLVYVAPSLWDLPLFSTAHAQTAPTLTIPQNLSAAAGTQMQVPIQFAANSHSITSIIFSLDFDQGCLSLDPTDADQDGSPDAVVFNVSSSFGAGATYNPADTDGELDITIADFSTPLAALPTGTPVVITFNVAGNCAGRSAAVTFSNMPSPSFGNTSGQSVPGIAIGSSVYVASALTMAKSADQTTVTLDETGAVNGYTIGIFNNNSFSVTLTSLVDTLPAGFVYTPSSTTGFTTDDPSIAGQSLTWTGNFVIPRFGALEMHFAVSIPADQPPGFYGNSVTGAAVNGSAQPVLVAGVTNAAIIEVPVPAVVEETNVNTDSGTTYTDPVTGDVTVGMPWGFRTDLVISIVATCLDANEEPIGAVLQHNGRTYPMYAITGTPVPDFEGIIPADDVSSGAVEVDVTCRNTSTGVEVIETDRVAEVMLFDPSGFVTDEVTGDPIVGATVTLYKENGWLPDTAGTTADCRTIETRGFSGWTQPADESLGVLPGTLIIEPDTNPQQTNSQGRYGWDVAAGCWYVTVEASGYFSKTSPVVGVPPEVTDLDITLTPINVSAPKLSIQQLGSNLQIKWTTHAAHTGYVVHISETPFFTPTIDTEVITFPSAASSYTHASAVGDGINYFYQVVASTAGDPIASNEVGKIDYAINRMAGAYSLIAVPFSSDTIVDAASLATHIGNVGSLLKWNPANQSFRFFVPPSIGDNFAVLPGDVIFVSSNGSGSSYTTLIGKVERNEYHLTPERYNFIAIPLQRSDLPNAGAVATDLGNIASLLSWNANTQTFRFFAVPNIGDNFALTPGAPVIGQLTNQGPIRWPSDE